MNRHSLTKEAAGCWCEAKHRHENRVLTFGTS